MGDGRPRSLDDRYLSHSIGFIISWSELDARAIKIIPDTYPKVNYMFYAIQDSLKSQKVSQKMGGDLDKFSSTGTGLYWLPFGEIIGWANHLHLIEPRFDETGGYKIIIGDRFIKYMKPRLENYKECNGLVKEVLEKLQIPIRESSLMSQFQSR